MKGNHLTLRIPRELARALARWDRERGVPKSHLVREAVARYLTPTAPDAASRKITVTAAELAVRWRLLPRLTPDEAKAFGGDIAAGQRELPEVRAAWE